MHFFYNPYKSGVRTPSNGCDAFWYWRKDLSPCPAFHYNITITVLPVCDRNQPRYSLYNENQFWLYRNLYNEKFSLYKSFRYIKNLVIRPFTFIIVKLAIFCVLFFNFGEKVFRKKFQCMCLPPPVWHTHILKISQAAKRGDPGKILKLMRSFCA